MLSGIGPKLHLALNDIETIAEAAVGQNLQDHALFFIGPFSFDRNKTAQPNLDRDFSEDTLHEYINQRTGEFEWVKTKKIDFQKLQFDKDPFAGTGFGLAGGALIKSSSGTEKWPDLYYNLASLNMKPDTADLYQKTFGFKDGVIQK